MFQVPEILNSFLIFKWSDFIEITIFSTSIFYFSKWLKRDSDKKLLRTFYAACTIFVLADYFGLFTLSNFLFSFAPAFLMLFILLHQNKIQQNFIATKNITPAQLEKTNWISELIKTMLHAGDSGKEIYSILECQDSIKNYIQKDIELSSYVKKDILDLLINSNKFSKTGFIYINGEGKIESINNNFSIPENLIVISNQEKELNDWQKNCIKLTTKIDAIAIKNCSQTRSFEIIAEGKIIDNIYADQTISIIDQLTKKRKFKRVEGNNEYKKNRNNQQYNA